MSRYRDPEKPTPIHSMTNRDMEAAERRTFTAAYEQSRHNTSNPNECRCEGPGPLCRFCPERHTQERRAA